MPVFRLYKYLLVTVFAVSMLLLQINEAFSETMIDKLLIIQQPNVAVYNSVLAAEDEPIVSPITYEPFEVTALTQEEFDDILLGTGMEEYGAYFEDIEAEYNVNGVYAIAVALYESGDGYSGLAVHNYNYFGFRGSNGWMSFESPGDGILYFGKLMNYEMYFEKTLEDIAKVYCPGSWDSWTNKINNTMEVLFAKLELE